VSLSGGWLVLESWIVPSLFSDNNVADGSGEWEFCAQLGKAKCAEVLAQHWSSWVQEGDIAQLAAAGITHVRIPVG
jgi:glucan 1,3-beta-glucosidase